MRSLSCLALAVAALTSLACGSAATTDVGDNNVSNALETVVVDGVVSSDNPFRLVGVTVDAEGTGCTVDGARFGQCVFTRTEAASVDGLSLNVCELKVNSGATYNFECDSEEAAGIVERYQERVGHCPEGG